MLFPVTSPEMAILIAAFGFASLADFIPQEGSKRIISIIAVVIILSLMAPNFIGMQFVRQGVFRLLSIHEMVMPAFQVLILLEIILNGVAAVNQYLVQFGFGTATNSGRGRM